MEKIIIYVSSYCPYCHKVQDFVSRNNLEVEYQMIDDPQIRNELILHAGKAQVPYLIDKNYDIKMHESDDIIVHVEKYYV